jgi:hypothetical protein
MKDGRTQIYRSLLFGLVHAQNKKNAPYTDQILTCKKLKILCFAISRMSPVQEPIKIIIQIVEKQKQEWNRLIFKLTAVSASIL